MGVKYEIDIGEVCVAAPPKKDGSAMERAERTAKEIENDIYRAERAQTVLAETLKRLRQRHRDIEYVISGGTHTR